ncbi:MAG: GMC family oxidoreductase N-terminal domain-containing protein [Alphaproteobacteria bacterium]|jgi:choline dehydrogenase|nr:GMC family oxidoreductase N-terminal domain-containing protein [Alphaproteobacteria bacterium]MDP6564740.1 GMC family oxidoreductase N-terminal domain-containing protein [Alphaproteobacteria bacterium]MDP6812571.1 GMC family oxidoreductase N-terminal domain-containing protein [Alphaproteobacteria bacterium]
MADKDAAQYDYIIIGAGSAGAALAHRLTEDPANRVLLLEAGKANHPSTRLPVSFSWLIDHPIANWCFTSDPEPGTADRAIPVPRGKLLGGSSAINGLVYVRGQSLDYDTWAQLGNRDWSWRSVEPIFRRMENYQGGGDGGRGRGGPLGVSEVPDQNPLYDALFAAAEAAGHRRNPDYNGPDQEGIVKTQATIRRGRRMSTAHCYLRPARGRGNLHIVTEALTQHLILDGRRCLGVAYAQGGQVTEARAGREVILSAGAIGSPKILELSGIGRPEVLAAHGIDVQHELPAVGENFRDHINARIQWQVTAPGVSYNERAQGANLVGQVAKYLISGGGFLSLPSAPLLAFLKTRPELATPDVQMHLVPYAVKDPKRRKLHDFPGMTVACYQLRPESLGSIHIQSAEPKEQPAIRFNFLADRIDRAAMVEGFKMMRRIVEAPPMDPFRGEEYSPGKAVDTDQAIEQWIRENSETAYHPIGTCRMGPGPNTVVDDQLKVHGLDGLRIADASIFPTMPSGNTNAPAIMVGEKCADLIKASAH